MPNDPIKKSIPGMIAAVGLSLATGQATPKPAQAPAAAAVPKATRPWTSQGLDPEMHPIAHLESSWGKNMQHAQHPKGLFHTAFGAVGMKPVTAHEQYLRTPTIQKLYPNLTKPEVFTQHLLEDPILYNLTASAHWQWLRKKLGTPAKAAYGWRWGATAAKNVPDKILNLDSYVGKFVQMSAGKLGKAESLSKMALIHDNAAKPMTVYRVQNNRGLGPYDGAGWGFENGNDGTPIGANDPSPKEDFTMRDQKQSGLIEGAISPKFAFTHPEHAEKWFTRAGLDQLATEGYRLQPVKAAKVWRSKTGAQVMYHTPEQVNPKPVGTAFPKLGKMAISDVTPGEQKGRFAWDYSHLLTPENKMAGYQIYVAFHPGDGRRGHLGDLLPDRFHGQILHNGKPIGQVHAAVHSDCLGGPCIEPHSEVQEGHHRRGLGTAMYEAVFKEAKAMGINSVHGYSQSPEAIKLHQALARKHQLGYRPGQGALAGDQHRPWFGASEFKYPIDTQKSEQLAKEEESDIRTLLGSDSFHDWTIALKRPQATSEDMDHLLDRISQFQPNEFNYPARTIRTLMELPLWGAHHHARAMMIPAFRSHGNTSLFLYHEKADGSTIDRVLEDPDVWLPKIEATYAGGLPSRPELSSVIDDVRITPAQYDKVLHLIHTENLYDEGARPHFFDGGQVEPEFLNKWFDAGVVAKNWGLVRNVAARANTVPGMFEKIMALTGDPLETALDAYSASSNMAEEHLRHLFSHPSSWVSGPDNEDERVHQDRQSIRGAAQTGLERISHVSPALADLAVNHPNRNIRDSLSSRHNLPPEICRKLYEAYLADPRGRPGEFIWKTSCPEDIRLDYTKRLLDEGGLSHEGGAVPHWLSIGTTASYDENQNQIGLPFSKEMVDLIVNHPNPTLLPVAIRSPNLTTEHALKIVERGYAARLVNGNQEYGISQPLLDKKVVVNALAGRPQDSDARLGLGYGDWARHLTPEFFESVTQTELAALIAGKGTRDQRNTAKVLVDGTRSTATPAPVSFLRQAMAYKPLMEDVLYHPNLPQQDFDENFVAVMEGTDDLSRYKDEKDPATIAAAIKVSQDVQMGRFLDQARGRPNPNIQDRHLQHAHNLLKERSQTPELAIENSSFFDRLYDSHAWSPDALEKLWHEEKLFNSPLFGGQLFQRHGYYSNPADGVRGQILSNPRCPESVIVDFLSRHAEPGMDTQDLSNTKVHIMEHRALSKKALLQLRAATAPNPHDPQMPYTDPGLGEVHRIAGVHLDVYDPDRVFAPNPGDNRTDDDNAFQGEVYIRPGQQKLRKIRELIMAKSPELGEVKPKDLPPGDWSAGRLPNGNISAKKLAEHIDAQEAHRYNFSHQYWTGAQRHNAQYDYDEETGIDYGAAAQPPQKVFQLNVSNVILDKLAEAGVDHTFRRMVNLSHNSHHPVRENHTLGWIRYDGEAQDGYHIDEIQSDLGQSFVRQMAAQAQEAGHDEAGVAEAAARAQKEYPDEHYNIIKNLVFQGKHPNEILLEGFHQYLRDQGKADAKVHLLHAETKAPLSNMDPKKPIPAHMQFTYSQLPKKMGMEPKQYGDLPSQSNTKLQKKPTFGGKVHKFETALSHWAQENGIEDLAKSVEQGDFKTIAKVINPVGAATVDHRPHLDSHPSHMSEEVNDYRANVLESPTRNRRISAKGLDGNTRKVVYKTKAPDGTERKYMVKPYHERVDRRARHWMQHPIQGWAEMANQALYHAAAIGHLHQKVHVSEHPMSVDAGPTRQEPALVVHLADGFKPVLDHKFTAHDADLHEDVRKIGLMDFLTNGLDRHGLNLLVNPETRKVMAIDHSRSFQYRAASKPMRLVRPDYTTRLIPPETGEDSLGNYIRGNNAIAAIVKPPADISGFDAQYKYLQDWGKTIEEWWPSVSAAVRKEMGNQLKQIKNPKLADHIRNNFDTRANLLDEMARDTVENYGLDDWHESPVEIHQYKG